MSQKQEKFLLETLIDHLGPEMAGVECTGLFRAAGAYVAARLTGN
jgi:hypothetical protein